jgi:hypothetical protein
MSDTMTLERETREAPPGPPDDLHELGRLVGTWAVLGDARGTVTYEWMEGGFFLLQRVDLEQDGQPIRGVEIIGHDQPFGDGPSDEIRSRYYDNAGNTLDYVYELECDTLTIWAGDKGSPVYYRGVFSTDGTTLTGHWFYPGGGGYDSTAIRIG